MGLEYNKRIFGTKEFYGILKDAFCSMKDMRNARKKSLVDKDFMHRIMLAVTEVNGCRVCSYFHTEQALKDGMSDEEITMILNGSLENVPPGEGIGLFFAQHYADKRGRYDNSSWVRLMDEYGFEKAKGILAATRIIMMGNAYGIAYGCLKSRLMGKKIEGSSLLSELGIMFGSIFLIPIAMVLSLFHKE
jgi:AhpD family alkylhydroperoxidase